MTKKKKGIILGSVAVVAAALIIVPKALKGPELPVVRTMSLAPTTLSNTVSVTGTVESSESYKVYATTTGQVDQVMVKVGDRVKAGDVLCQFDVETLEMNIAQTEATLNQTQNAAYQQLRTAQKNLENAQNNLENGLNSSIISADSAVDSAQIGKQNANLSLESAKDNVDSIQDTLSDYREAYSDARSAERDADEAVREYQKKYNELYNETKDTLQEYADNLENKQADLKGKMEALSSAQATYDEHKQTLSSAEAELAQLQAIPEEQRTDEQSDRIQYLEEEYIPDTQNAKDEAFGVVGEAAAEVAALQLEITMLQQEYSSYEASSGLSTAKAMLDAAKQAQSSATSAKLQAKSALEASRSSTNAADTALDQAELGVKSAQSSYNTALAQQAATEAMMQQQIDSYKDAVTAAQIQGDTTAQQIALQQLYKQLDDATVTAPISGTVTAVYAEEGSPSSGLLFIIEDVDNLEVSTSIKEYDVTSVKEGMPIVIRTDAIDGQEFAGVLSEIAPTASKNAASTSSTVTFDATVKVSEQNTGLRVGMNTRMDIVLEEKENTFGVPYDAIHTSEDGGNFIIAVTSNETGDGFVTKYIPVTTGMETDFYIEVLSDELTEGLQIIATGDLIAEGTAVQVM